MTKIQSENKGLIYNIQRYSLHDGPGIRTIVFLKGCPMECPWCANPESQKKEIELMGTDVIGQEKTVEEIINVVKRDKIFYNRSNGGLTLSGGEPLMQPDFSRNIAIEARKEGINVAIETSGYQKWELLWSVIEQVDIVLYDIKMMDYKRHKEVIGVSNEIILNNAINISKMKKEMIVRVPIIPGYNDSFENLEATAKFCKEIGVSEIHFLPYHRLGVHKYSKLNREYKLHDIGQVSKENLKNIATNIEEQMKINITIY